MSKHISGICQCVICVEKQERKEARLKQGKMPMGRPKLAKLPGHPPDCNCCAIRADIIARENIRKKEIEIRKLDIEWHRCANEALKLNNKSDLLFDQIKTLEDEVRQLKDSFEKSGLSWEITPK